MDKFKGLGSQKKIDEVIQRRRKKNASKEKKKLPRLRVGRNEGGSGL